MKKKNLKALKLNKKSISSLETPNVKGGGTSYFSCITGVCAPNDTEITCPTWAMCDFTKAKATCSICDA